MKKRIKSLTKNDLIRSEHIEIITGMDEEAAERERLYIIQALETGSKDLMIKQFCAFMGYDCKEVVQFLRGFEECEELVIIDDDDNLTEIAWTHY